MSSRKSSVKQEVKDLSHLFYECEKVLSIWKGIKNYIVKIFYHSSLSIDVKSVITNKIVVRQNHVANLICLVTKSYIYSQRCMEQDLVIDALLQKIKSIERRGRDVSVRKLKAGYKAVRYKWLKKRVIRSRGTRKWLICGSKH